MRVTLAAICVSSILPIGVHGQQAVIRPSAAPAQTSTISVDAGSVDAEGATLPQILKALAPQKKFEIAPALQDKRFDVTLTNAGPDLFGAFRAIAEQQIGVEIAKESRNAVAWVLRPAAHDGAETSIEQYPPERWRAHFYYPRCPVEHLARSFERQLNAPVAVEPEGLILSNVRVEWVARASMMTAVKHLHLSLTEERRDVEVWTVTNR